MASDRRCTELCHRRDGGCSGCIGAVVVAVIVIAFAAFAAVPAARPGALWLLPAPGMQNAGCCAADVVMSGSTCVYETRQDETGRRPASRSASDQTRPWRPWSCGLGLLRFLCPDSSRSRRSSRSTCGCLAGPGKLLGSDSNTCPSLREPSDTLVPLRFSRKHVTLVCVARSQWLARSVSPRRPRANGTAPEIEMASASLSRWADAKPGRVSLFIPPGQQCAALFLARSRALCPDSRLPGPQAARLPDCRARR